MIIGEFVKRGIQVSIPFGDNARYDLIAEFNGKLNRIQVKYCNQKMYNGSICCPCASSLNHTTNRNKTTYNEDVDYIAFYIKAFDACCLVPIEDIGTKKSIYFRKEPTKHAKSDSVHIISDYSFDQIYM